MAKNPANFTGRSFTNKATGFETPTMLPRDEAEHDSWQQANKAWWESSPMRYDWRETVQFAPHSKEFYAEIDRRFLSSVKAFLPWRNRPFEQYVPYDKLPEMDVLEIGVGQGTHAQLIAPHCKSYTGIDLTEAASEATSKRLKLFGLQGQIFQMDAELMNFPDASFDYIWSWGVIHHSADTKRILSQMHRVLRPGGRATVMVYHRNWWNFLIVAGLLKGLVQAQFRDLTNLHRVAQGATDGAIARYYKPKEWRALTSDKFEIERFRICGVKSEVIPLPPGRLKQAAEKIIPDAVTRLATNGLKLGTFLVADMRRL
jgi:ubiquinone/menaquinone biosynthesis C-methylase UbiE